MARFKKSLEQVREESDRAREMVVDVLRRKGASFIWSYETFMFLGKDYLDLLYEFLEVASDFMPPLEDGNKKRILA